MRAKRNARKFLNSCPVPLLDMKFGSEATMDTVQNGSQLVREDEGIIGSIYLNCNIASLLMGDPIPFAFR
jgi:hypothetical protein